MAMSAEVKLMRVGRGGGILLLGLGKPLHCREKNDANGFDKVLRP